MNPDYGGLARALLPETALVAGAVAVLGLDLTLLRGRAPGARLRAAAGVAALAVAAAALLSLKVGLMGPVFGGVLILDPLAGAARLAILVLALLVLGIATGAPAPRHPAEYAAIILFATAGMTLMAAAQQLLLAFLALELASLSLYVLAGFDKSRPESAEAALKYFLFGGMSAAFLLFGFSLLYGLTGSIELPRIAAVVAGQGMSPLLAVALVMILVSFGFKTSAAPFHLWAPDAYQGAPVPSAALIASASKLAGYALFVRLLWPGLGAVAGNAASAPLQAGWMPLVAALAAASILVGNLVALAQADLRRLLAYSAIAHAGSLLLGVIAAGAAGPAPLFYYASTYGIAAAGAFGTIAVLEGSGGCRSIADLAGLSRRSPLLAGCLLVFVLSLAGIPPLAGFFGKFAVYAAALAMGGVSGPVGWIAILAILMSAVALYYYLGILRQAFVAAPREGAPKVVVAPFAALALLAAAGLVIVLGLAPRLILGLFPAG
jgi:NADH-quinone oxidoreductase subunit N